MDSHHHRLHTAFSKPLGQAVQVGGEGLKLPHRLFCPVGRNRHEMAGGAHINSCRVQIQLGQFPAGSAPLLPLLITASRIAL